MNPFDPGWFIVGGIVGVIVGLIGKPLIKFLFEVVGEFFD
ncbi:hypothetical protein SAMN05518848_102224 [Paenibacillus sp. PDC88]|nr:hypothetical protein SAMN05518848_102224 [Paenibacillus sp. PDC88]